MSEITTQVLYAIKTDVELRAQGDGVSASASKFVRKSENKAMDTLEVMSLKVDGVIQRTIAESAFSNESVVADLKADRYFSSSAQYMFCNLVCDISASAEKTTNEELNKLRAEVKSIAEILFGYVEKLFEKLAMAENGIHGSVNIDTIARDELACVPTYMRQAALEIAKLLQSGAKKDDFVQIDIRSVDTLAELDKSTNIESTNNSVDEPVGEPLTKFAGTICISPTESLVETVDSMDGLPDVSESFTVRILPLHAVSGRSFRCETIGDTNLSKSIEVKVDHAISRLLSLYAGARREVRLCYTMTKMYKGGKIVPKDITAQSLVDFDEFEIEAIKRDIVRYCEKCAMTIAESSNNT